MYFAVAILYSLIFRRRNYCVTFPLSINFARAGIGIEPKIDAFTWRRKRVNSTHSHVIRTSRRPYDNCSHWLHALHLLASRWIRHCDGPSTHARVDWQIQRSIDLAAMLNTAQRQAASRGKPECLRISARCRQAPARSDRDLRTSWFR